MSDFINETRTLGGETATIVNDGWTWFRLGRSYQLTYERRGEGTVAIVLDHHERVSEGAPPLVVSEAEFGRWFRR